MQPHRKPGGWLKLTLVSDLGHNRRSVSASRLACLASIFEEP
jgi:hypothetical protein